MKRFFVCSVSFCFFLAAAVLADVTMRDIWRWGLVRKSDLPLYATTGHVADAVAPMAAHTNRADNPHGVTAAQIGALTAEQDLAALRTYHYGSPDIVESPEEWFVFDGAGTITAFNWEVGRENVVIPWAIGGVPVTVIGANAFRNLVTYQGHPVVSVVAPQTVTAIGSSAFDSCRSLTSVIAPQATVIGGSAFAYCTALASIDLPQATSIGDYAFAYCDSLSSAVIPQVASIGFTAFSGCLALTYVDLPQATSIGDSAFADCRSLASVYFDNDAPTIGAGIFEGLPPNQVTNYVTNPQATGWGATLGGMPVVRLPLYADAIYQAGELVATEAHVAQALAAIPEPDLSDHPTFSHIAASNALPYTAWTGTITPANGTATVTIAHGNMPVLVTTAPCVLTLDPTGYGTAGVSRVSLSYYPGTNSFTFATNVINYAETPSVDTNGWNTLLIRRVSDGAWKGVGL